MTSWPRGMGGSEGRHGGGGVGRHGGTEARRHEEGDEDVLVSRGPFACNACGGGQPREGGGGLFLPPGGLFACTAGGGVHPCGGEGVSPPLASPGPSVLSCFVPPPPPCLPPNSQNGAPPAPGGPTPRHSASRRDKPSEP